MLVLSRKAEQSIQIGDEITITILKVKGNTVRVGISAPNDVRVMRGELQFEMEAECELAQAQSSCDSGQPVVVFKSDKGSSPRFEVESKDSKAGGAEAKPLQESNSINESNGLKDRLQRRSTNKTNAEADGNPVNRILSLFPDSEYRVDYLRFSQDEVGEK